MFEFLYPVTDVLNKIGFLIDIMSLDEIRTHLSNRCLLLTERAVENKEVGTVNFDVLSEYGYHKLAESNIISKNKDFEVLSPLYSANLDHPECQSLIELCEMHPTLVNECVRDIVISPFCLPLISKFIPYLDDYNLEADIVTLYERTNLDNPENLFIPLTEKLFERLQIKIEFVQTVAHYFIGPWCNDIDYSKSTISGGIVCCIIQTILGYDNVLKKYLPYNLDILTEHPEDLSYIRSQKYCGKNIEIYSNSIVKINEIFYKFSHGCDVDIGVHTDNEDEFHTIAREHFDAVAKYFPGVILSRKGDALHYKIYYEDPVKYFEGFRNVDIYLARECRVLNTMCQW